MIFRIHNAAFWATEATSLNLERDANLRAFSNRLSSLPSSMSLPVGYSFPLNILFCNIPLIRCLNCSPPPAPCDLTKACIKKEYTSSTRIFPGFL
uniref:Uncharacterized protein n=1 Tax=Arundo donax TaxID=35708 RepID=A0A0A9FHM3_ARUDO